MGNIGHDKSFEENKLRRPKYQKDKYLVPLILISILLIAIMCVSFFWGPTGMEYKKVIKTDGVTVSYFYEFKNFDDETILKKTYVGTDKDGNKIDVKVSIWYKGKFEGKVDKKYKEDVANHALGVIKLSGTINSKEISDSQGRKLIGDIDEALYEKYTAMYDEVKGCGLYVKFVDGNVSYTCINKDLLILLISVIVFELLIICVFVANKIRNKKLESGEFGEREANIQHKFGVGVLIGSLMSLITSILLGLILSPTYFVVLFALTVFLGFVGKGMIRECVIQKVLKVILVLMLIVLIPILFIFFLFAIL